MLTIALALMYDISLIDASKNQGTTKTQTVIDFLIHYIKVLMFVNLRNLLEKSLLGCFLFSKAEETNHMLPQIDMDLYSTPVQ